MKNKHTITYKWAYLPFVFSSAAIIATAASAAPGTSQQYQDSRQVSTANYEYVGGKTQIGFGVTDDGDVSVDLNQVLSETENSSTSAGLWAGYELKGDDKGVKGRGVQVNHNWVSRDSSGRATRVNKVFGAYDRNEAGHAKATVGYGQENESLFWEGHASKGLSDRKDGRKIDGKIVSNAAYDYGVGASVGTFLKGSNMRVRAGLDHEWGDDVGEGESTAKNTTLSAGIEKFFQGTPHSLGLDVAASKQSGGYGSNSDTDVTGKASYRYDFGGASIYQPDRRYRRVRVEVPGNAVAPRYTKKAQYKRVPTYKTVTTYGKKSVRKPYKQLVKSTMELEGQTFFKLNSSRLIPSARTRLLQVAAQIRKNGYKGSIRITGNTCGLGDAAYDQRLSEQRANEVKNFLIENGFNPRHLIARGLGKGHPKFPNTPDQGFKNRRVDIEYVTERKAYKTGYRTEQQTVKTGTRKVATGFKNVPVGHTNVLIDSGRPGTPRVIWKTEVIPSSPAWIKRALHNNIKHNTQVNTYQTTAGSGSIGDNVVYAGDDTVTVCNANQTITIDVLQNDDSDATITGIVTQPANGIAEINNGKIVFTPSAGFSGTDHFTYEVTDQYGNTTTAKVTVTVCSSPSTVNVANDAATTDQGQAVTIDVLSNDDQDARINRIVKNPDNGTVRIVNGQIIYTPAAGFSGKDSFTYEAIDPQGNKKTATVVVTVNATGGGTVNAADDTASTPQGQAVTIDVLSNDDQDASIDRIVSQPSNGTASIVNGQILYTPKAGFTGTDSFTYEVSDPQGNKTIATVSVTVTAAGQGGINAGDDTAYTSQGQAVTIDVLSNDDQDATIDRVVSQPSSGTASIVNGQILYTPKAGFTGTDSFTYEVSDPQGNKTIATVTVTVTAAGQGGINAGDDTASTPQGQAVTINVLSNDDQDASIDRVVSQPSNGTASIVNGQILYTPKAGFTGTDSFTYEVSDPQGNKTIATVTVTVTAAGQGGVNASDDTASTPQGQAVSIDVLSNDDADALLSGTLTQPSYGAVSIVNGEIVYTPNASFAGSDTFTYEVIDPQGNTTVATVTVTVQDSGVQSVDDTASTPQGQAVTIDVLSNDDSDASLTGTLTQPSNGTASIVNNQIVYTPTANFTGQDTFTYEVTDPQGNKSVSTVTVTVNPVAGGFGASDDTATITGANASVTIDVMSNDDEAVKITSITDAPENGTATIVNGKIVYTPNQGFSGTDYFNYEVEDANGKTDIATVAVTVSGSASTPDAINDNASTDCSAVTINVLDNDTGSGLSIFSVGNAGLGNAVISGNTIVYTPSASCSTGNTGEDSFSYTVKDGQGNTSTATVKVDVTGCNTCIKAVSDEVFTDENQPVVISVLENDAGKGLRIVSVDTPMKNSGTVEIVGNSIRYTPNSGFTGEDSFYYDIEDENGNKDAAMIIIYVGTGD